MIEWFRSLLKSPSPTRTYFYLLATLSFVYVLQAWLFLLPIKRYGEESLSMVKNLAVIALAYPIVFVILLMYSCLASILAWKISQTFSGKGGFAETRLMITCSLICTAPTGFFHMLFRYTHNHPGMDGARAIDAFSLLGISILVIYGWIVLVKGLAEVHHISLSRAFVASLGPVSIFFQYYPIA